MTEQEFYQMLGGAVRKLRKKAKMNQKEVAKKAGIHQGDLSAFESKGDKIKSANHIRMIVEATGHTMRDLFDEEGEKKTLSSLRFQVQG